jgi:hypothetical protein
MALGFYAQGAKTIELPHPAISLAVYLVVENGIRAAWELMRNNPRNGFDLGRANEDIVTHELYERLYDEVFDNNVVEGFDRELLTAISRESKLRTYDGYSLDKMPDLLFGLADRPGVFRRTQDWLFVECKPVDDAHSLGVHYCGKGIIRFVKGEYAWAMTSALMVGYVSTGYSISRNLTDALVASTTIETLDLPNVCCYSSSIPGSETVQISKHVRRFTYIETHKTGGAIMIRHLWLRRD